MIVQIVLVIVTVVQVNSQELCPSVCQCYSDNAACTDLFSDVTNMTQHWFQSGLRRLRVTASKKLELEENLFLRWNITSLIFLGLSQNNIRNIGKQGFYSLSYLQTLKLSGNNITTLHSQTFYYNTRLARLSLSKNNIPGIHTSK